MIPKNPCQKLSRWPTSVIPALGRLAAVSQAQSVSSRLSERHWECLSMEKDRGIRHQVSIPGHTLEQAPKASVYMYIYLCTNPHTNGLTPATFLDAWLQTPGLLGIPGLIVEKSFVQCRIRESPSPLPEASPLDPNS